MGGWGGGATREQFCVPLNGARTDTNKHCKFLSVILRATTKRVTKRIYEKRIDKSIKVVNGKIPSYCKRRQQQRNKGKQVRHIGNTPHNAIRKSWLINTGVARTVDLEQVGFERCGSTYVQIFFSK